MSILHCDLVPYGIYSYLSGYVVLLIITTVLPVGRMNMQESVHTSLKSLLSCLLTFPCLTSPTVVSNLSHVYLSHSLTRVEILNLNAQI